MTEIAGSGKRTAKVAPATLGIRETPKAKGRPDGGGSDGYAALEALVSLLILSLSLGFGLAAYQQASRAAAAALEINRARGLVGFLLASAPEDLGQTSGAARDFSWRLDFQKTGSGGLVDICRRSVSVRNTRSNRSYAMAQLTACPPEAGS